MRKWKLPVYATLAYILVGSAWIVTGYFLSGSLYENPPAARFELLKGLAYVGVTASVLFIALTYLDRRGADSTITGDLGAEFEQSLQRGDFVVRWLPALVIFACGITVAILALGLWWVREHTLQAGERSALALQKVHAEQMNGVLDSINFTLRETADVLSKGKFADPVDELRRRIPDVATSVSSIAIADLSGRITHNSDANTQATSLDLSTRDYFLHHKNNPLSELYLSAPLRGKPSGHWLLVASRAIRSSSGKFMGIVVAVIDTAMYGNYWQPHTTTDDSTLSLFMKDGTLLLRSPYREDAIGRSDRHDFSLASHGSTDQSAFRAKSLIDGNNRIYASGPVTGYPQLRLVVGLSQKHLLESWNAFALISLFVYLMVVSSLTALTFGLLRQLRERLVLQRKAADLARYPLQNRNPVLTVTPAGRKLFMNDAAKQLFDALLDSHAAHLDNELQSIAAESKPGTREFSVGTRVMSASFVPHAPDYCDIYLMDITSARQGENLLQLFFELPFIGMAITSPKTKHWLRFNDRLCEILGYTRHELEHKTWAELTHPDDIAADVAEFERILRGDTNGYALDKRFVRPDGTVIDAAIDVHAIRLPDGTIETFLATVQDITDRKQHERVLLDQRNLYAALSATNDAIIRTSERDTLFQRVCEVAVAHSGLAFVWIGMVDSASQRIRPVARAGDGENYINSIEVSTDPSQALGRGPAGLLTASGKRQVINRIASEPTLDPWREALRKSQVQSLAVLPILQGGKLMATLHLYSRKPDYFDEDILRLLDEMAANLSFALDTLNNNAQRLQAEQQRQESEAKFKGLVEQTLVGTFIADSEKIIYANPRLCEIFGYPPDAMVGRSLKPLIVAEDSAGVADSLRLCVDGKTDTVRREFRGLRQDGTVIVLGLHGSHALISGRSVVVGVLQDITDKQLHEKQINEYLARLERSIISTIEAISHMVDLRDPYTSGHERRVGELAAAIGTEIGLSEHQVTGLRVAGGVHDVGKIAVPAEILSKPTRLSAPEFAIVKTHAQQGYEILKDIEFPWPVAITVWQHHERLDGSGYPRGLRGDEICLEARIMAVADVVESMSTHRPYRPALGIEAAIAELQGKAGTLYDPAIVAACVRLFHDKGYKFTE